MKLLSHDRALKRRRIIRFNILSGVLVFGFAFFMLATTDFASYQELKNNEALYNRLALGGLIYAAASWIFCVMSKPFWFPKS